MTTPRTYPAGTVPRTGISAADVGLTQPAPKPPVESWPGEPLELTPPPDKRARRRQSREEHEEQVKYFRWVDDMGRADPRYLLIAAMPNENMAGENVGRYRKAEGVRAGYEDILIDWAGGPFVGARLEHKNLSGGRTRDNQKEWHKRHLRAGFYTQVCDGCAELQEATIWYFSQRAAVVLLDPPEGGRGEGA